MDLFKFDKDILVNYLNHDYKLQKKIKSSFKFVVEKLGVQDVNKVSDLKWLEEKNYNWAVLRSDNVILLIRHYRYHFTFYCEFTDNIDNVYKNTEFTIFTYFTNIKLIKTHDEQDERCDNNFMDIDASIDSIIKIIKEGHSHLLWNSAAVHIPYHTEITIASNDHTIYSFDKLIFATEELSSLEMQLFAENDMWDMLKKLKIGDSIGSQTITNLSIDIKDNYYYSLGLSLNGSFKDIYSLTSWYLSEIKETLGLNIN